MLYVNYNNVNVNCNNVIVNIIWFVECEKKTHPETDILRKETD